MLIFRGVAIFQMYDCMTLFDYVRLGGGNSNILYFTPIMGKIPILTIIFSKGFKPTTKIIWMYDYANICLIIVIVFVVLLSFVQQMEV